MTSPEPFDSDDLRLMWRVLASWVRGSEGRADSALMLAKLRDFPALGEVDVLQTLSRTSLPFKMFPDRWLVGDPLPKRQPIVIPIVSVSLGAMEQDRVTDAAMKVALLSERKDEGTIHAEGWRFEQGEARAQPSGNDPEPGPALHPYCHAQAIIGWVKGANCLIHPPHLDGDGCDGVDRCDAATDKERVRAASATLVSHPAFPLPAKTLTGLALVLVATLYGAQKAKDIVIGDRTMERVTGDIRADLVALRIFAT